MLEYDNSAFYYFSITILVIYIIPGTWYAVSELFYAFLGSGDVGTIPRTTEEKQKALKLKQQSSGVGRLKKPAYIINLVILLISWIVFLYLISLVINDGEVSTFDPFTILGIEQGAALGEIKKAYRRLSLQYHPDKNIGNKKAEEMFMKVAKAYEALTDETAKENYEKYGNPDGKQSLEVSIGLPRILLDNPKVVLILYLIGMVFVIPVGVGLWYANSKQYGENNVKNSTYQIIYSILLESHRTRNMPEVVAASEECQIISKRGSSRVPEALVAGKRESLSTLYGKLKSDKLMLKPKYEVDSVLNGNLLLHAHCLRLTHVLTDDLRHDLDAMLSKSPDIIDGIIAIAYHRRWLETTLHAIRFSQCIVQGLWYTNDPLQQLPHLTDTEIKSINKTTKTTAINATSAIALSVVTSSVGTGTGKGLSEFLQLSDDDKRQCIETLDAAKQDEVLSVSKIFPNLQIDTKFFVEEEDDEDDKSNSDVLNISTTNGQQKPKPKADQIFEQDLVTLRVIITRKNLDLGSSTTANNLAPPVYAPHFPKSYSESYWFILTDRVSSPASGKKAAGDVTIHAIEKVSEQTRVIKHELKFMAPQQAGTYEMDLFVISDAYMGLDQHLTLQFTVTPASELPEYVPHPEDLELDNEPTLFEQMMAANVDAESSGDEEDEEEEDDKVKVVSKKVQPVSSRVIELADDDDDDE